MKTTMRLTLDGLLRTLRGKGLGLVEEIEAGYRRPARQPRRPRGRPTAVRPSRRMQPT